MKVLASIAMVMAFAALVLPTAQAQSLKSLSYPVTMTSDNGDRYSQVTVSCKNKSAPSLIQKMEGGNQWCSGADSSACSSNKIKAANMACRASSTKGTSSSNQIAVEKNVKAPIAQTAEQTETDAALMARKAEDQQRFALEAELLKIEQEKLNLRRQQLELKKQELVLQDAAGE